MDNRRLNTSEVLFSGILEKPAPISNAPSDVKLADITYDWTEESIREGIEKGGVTASMYYGCWKVWKTEEFYNGELLQYRSITDSFENATIEEALEKAVEWANSCDG